MSRPLALVPPLPAEHRPAPTRLRRMLDEDDGMSTVEYAVGTVVAAGFALVLYLVLSSEPIMAAINGLLQRALAVNF